MRNAVGPLWRLLASIIFAAVLGQSDASARPLDEVIASKTLRVIVYRDNPPFSWIEDGQLKGIDVEIGRAIAHALGVEAEIIGRMTAEDVDDDLRFNVWKGPYSEGGVGDVMLHIPVDRDLRARNNLAVISNPYFEERVALAFDAERMDAPESFAFFREHKIAARYGTVEDYFLLRFEDGALINNVTHFTKLEKGADAFASKEVVAILGVRSDLEGVFHMNQIKAAFSEPPMPGIVRKHWVIGTAVNENSRDLGYAIGHALESLRASGRIEEIFREFGVTYVAPVT